MNAHQPGHEPTPGPGRQGRWVSSGWTRDSDAELVARIAWSRLAEPGDPVAARLVAQFGPVDALGAVTEGRAPDIGRFLPRLAGLDPQRDLEVALRSGATVLVPQSGCWPEGVQDLAAPPFCLYVRGDARLLTSVRDVGVAVVGARASSAYGETMAVDLAAGLAEAGFTVVSGAAYGVDAAAHQGALTLAGPTIAVLAGGVERPYPPRNADLIARIAAEGAVVSEVPPGSAPTRTRFLERNRLIATMSAGTVVVEAGLRSGSLSTARKAADHLRPVGAVPGPVTSPTSAGCHQAVRDGYAVLVTDAAEVAELVGGYGVAAPRRPSGPVRAGDELDPACRAVLAALPHRRPVEVGALAGHAGVAVPEVIASLGRLEAVGLALRGEHGWRKVRPPP